MEGKFVGFQILERDGNGDIYPYPVTAEDVATQLREMGYVVLRDEPEKFLTTQAFIDELRKYADPKHTIKAGG